MKYDSNSYNGFGTSVVFSGSDVIISIGNYIIDQASFFQLTPQQMMTPVYSIFSPQPTGFLEGNQLIRGVIGLNFAYANYFESLALSTQSIATILDNGVVLVPAMTVTFAGRTYTPIIELQNVYIFGGSLSATVEGTPIQVVHEFVAQSMTKSDSPQTIEMLSF